MLREYYEKKKEQYIEEIKKIANEPNLENKQQIIRNKLNKYYFFCYKHNIDEFDRRLNDIVVLNSSYIIESTPIRYEIEKEELNNAIAHLKEVLENNKYGLVDGITLNEAETILKAMIELARNNMEKYLKKTNDQNLVNHNQSGFCGFMQALTLIPLQKIGIETTVNNVTDFKSCAIRHAFGTASFPIKEKENIYKKTYLIDGSYRQFFIISKCIEARFYTTNKNFKDQVSPDPGYYVCLTEKGKEFARTLLKSGFIEWTPDSAKIYGEGFVCSSIINLKNLNQYHEIKKIAKEEYFKSIYRLNMEKLDFDKEKLEDMGCLTDLEIETLKR